MNGCREFKIKKFDTNYLEKNGFKLSRAFSDTDCIAYINSFMVYKYYDMGILDARFIIYSDKTVKIDVFDRCSKGLYAPWYVESPDRWEILEVVETNLLRLMKRLGIKDVTVKNKEINRNSKNTNKGE